MGNYNPDFTNVECTRELIIVHLYNTTLLNKNYVMTAHDISEQFKCTRHSASNMLRALKSHGDVTRLNGRNGQKRIDYAITEHGKNYAKNIIEKSLDKMLK